MPLAEKAHNVFRGLAQRYAPQGIKRRLWNNEFFAGRWNCLDSTGEDPVNPYVEKYANHGCILDLGCGPATISTELKPDAYRLYTGVDISDVAVQKARIRALNVGRADRSEFFEHDILTYKPALLYDVILYGDSIYYIPPHRIVGMLQRYSKCLTSDGVFIARIFDVSGKLHTFIDTIESQFDVVEKHLNDTSQVCILAFRPSAKSA